MIDWLGPWWALVALGQDGQELGRMDHMLRPECEYAVYQRAGQMTRPFGVGVMSGPYSISYTVTDKRGRRVTFTCRPDVKQ